MPAPAPVPAVRGPGRFWTLLAGVGLLVAWRLAWAGLAWHLSGLQPSLDSFVSHRAELDAWAAEQGPLALLVFLAIYTLVCGLCLDGTATLVVVAGALFGLWKGLAICTLGSTLGGLAAFLFARRFLSSWIRASFPKAVQVVDQGLAKDGDAWVLSSRLIPMVSFSLVNLALGLSRLSTWRFVMWTALGLLPCNAAYAWAGVNLAKVEAPKDLLEPRILLALCVLGLLPLLARLARRLPAALKRPG